MAVSLNDIRSRREESNTEAEKPRVECKVQVIDGTIHLVFPGTLPTTAFRSGEMKISKRDGKSYRSPDYVTLVTNESFPMLMTEGEDSVVVTVPARRAINLPVR